MRGKQHDFCLIWTLYLLFTVLLNNILIGASTLLPVSKIQLLRGGDSDGIKVDERNVWKRGEPGETAFRLHLLGSSRLKRVKRYESDRFSTYSESRKAYITEANRRHREEVARLNVLDVKLIFAVFPFCISISAGTRLSRRRWKSVGGRGRTSRVRSSASAALSASSSVAAALAASSNVKIGVEAAAEAALDKVEQAHSSCKRLQPEQMPIPLKEVPL